jgi:hypothetical protein
VVRMEMALQLLEGVIGSMDYFRRPEHAYWSGLQDEFLKIRYGIRLRSFEMRS